MCMMALAVAQFAVGALGAVAQYQSQQEAYAAQKAQYDQNIINARTAAINRYEAIQNSTLSEKRKAVEENVDVAFEGLAARGTAEAAASSKSTGGLSVQHLASSLLASEGRYKQRVDDNYDTAFTAYQDEMKATRDTAADRINAMPIPQRPSFLGAAVRIAGAGLDAFGGYAKNSKMYG